MVCISDVTASTDKESVPANDKATDKGPGLVEAEFLFAVIVNVGFI